jgi:DhnA family fructose-bisphosphate aldolase class Ia
MQLLQPSACSGRLRESMHTRFRLSSKINHNELMTLPNKFDQVLFGTVKEAHNLGAVAVGATIYFGSDESTRQIKEISEAFAHAHELGMACILWCYLRNSKVQNCRRRHARCGRSHEPGKSPWRDDSGRYHQAETSRAKRWLQVGRAALG